MAKKSYSGKEMKRYLGSLKEHFTDGIRAIGEQYFDLKKDIGELKKDMSEVKKTVDAHTKILESHTEMIGNIMVQLEEIKSDLKQKVDYQDFIRLRRRVTVLESRAGRR